MPFPFSHRSVIPSSDQILELPTTQELQQELSRLKATIRRVDGDHVQFSVSIFRFATSLNLLTFINSGDIWIDRTRKQLQYQLTFVREFVVLTILVPAIFGIPLYQAPNLSYFSRMAIMIAIWAWVFAMNYCLSVFRFRNWLAKLVERR